MKWALAKLSRSLHWFPAVDRVAWLYIVIVATTLATLNGILLRVSTSTKTILWAVG